MLYERYSGKLFGYCLHRLGSREEAEDAVQTTFVNALRGLRRGVVPQFEAAWLFKIAENVCHTRWEKAGRRSRVESGRDLQELQHVLPCPQHDDEDLNELTSALEGLPLRQRQAILLREWHGLTYREVAAELELSVPAVEALIFRARGSLAKRLEPRRPGRRLGTGSWLAGLKSALGAGTGAKAIAAAAAAVAVVAVAAPAHPLGPQVATAKRTRPARAALPGTAGNRVRTPAPAMLTHRSARRPGGRPSSTILRRSGRAVWPSAAAHGGVAPIRAAGRPAQAAPPVAPTSALPTNTAGAAANPAAPSALRVPVAPAAAPGVVSAAVSRLQAATDPAAPAVVSAAVSRLQAATDPAAAALPASAPTPGAPRAPPAVPAVVPALP